MVGVLIARHGFKVAFLVHALVSLPTFQIMRSFKVSSSSSKKSDGASTSPSPDFKAGLSHILGSPSALAFFFLVFVIGCSSGCVENFAYVRLRELGEKSVDASASRSIFS